MNSPESLIVNIKSLLSEKGLSGRGLADLAKMTPSQVSDYLNGHKVPSLEQIDRLAAALGVSTLDLVKPAKAARLTATESADPHASDRARLLAFIRTAKPHQIDTLLDIVEGFERRARKQDQDRSGSSG